MTIIHREAFAATGNVLCEKRGPREKTGNWEEVNCEQCLAVGVLNRFYTSWKCYTLRELFEAFPEDKPPPR